MTNSKLDLWDEKVIYQLLGAPFWGTALCFHIDLYEEDARFIEFIKKDNIFNKIPGWGGGRAA